MIDGYSMPLVSKEGLMYLGIIRKPTNEEPCILSISPSYWS